jgi:hypothetical protein
MATSVEELQQCGPAIETRLLRDFPTRRQFAAGRLPGQ